MFRTKRSSSGFSDFSVCSRMFENLSEKNSPEKANAQSGLLMPETHFIAMTSTHRIKLRQPKIFREYKAFLIFQIESLIFAFTLHQGLLFLWNSTGTSSHKTRVWRKIVWKPPPKLVTNTELAFCMDTKKQERGRSWPHRQSVESRIMSMQINYCSLQ